MTVLLPDLKFTWFISLYHLVTESVEHVIYLVCGLLAFKLSDFGQFSVVVKSKNGMENKV